MCEISQTPNLDQLQLEQRLSSIWQVFLNTKSNQPRDIPKYVNQYSQTLPGLPHLQFYDIKEKEKQQAQSQAKSSTMYQLKKLLKLLQRVECNLTAEQLPDKMRKIIFFQKLVDIAFIKKLLRNQGWAELHELFPPALRSETQTQTQETQNTSHANKAQSFLNPESKSQENCLDLQEKHNSSFPISNHEKQLQKKDITPREAPPPPYLKTQEQIVRSNFSNGYLLSIDPICNNQISMFNKKIRYRKWSNVLIFHSKMIKQISENMKTNAPVVGVDTDKEYLKICRKWMETLLNLVQIKGRVQKLVIEVTSTNRFFSFFFDSQETCFNVEQRVIKRKKQYQI